MFAWLKTHREKAERARRSVAISNDQSLIADQVPELAGMSDVEGMAHVFVVLDEFRANSTQEQRNELQRRLGESSASFDQQGLTMPYWGNLWVVRTYQAQLGWDVPAVKPPVQSED